MRISNIILILMAIVNSQVVKLTIDNDNNYKFLDSDSVQYYLDSLMMNYSSINYSYLLDSIDGKDSIKVKYAIYEEPIYIDTLYFKNNNKVNNQTYRSLFKSLFSVSSETEILKQIDRIESSFKFLHNSIHLTYGKTAKGGLALLIDSNPVFENNISGLFGANRTNSGDWITNGEIELYIENIWSTASNSLFHWKRLNEKSEIISFIHYEPTLWSLPFGLQFKFDKELRDQEYILQKRDFRIFSNPNRYGKWFFGSNSSIIIPTETGYSNGLLRNKSNSLLLGILSDKRNHRWIPTNGNYWNITISLGKQIENNISNLRGDWSLDNGFYWKINSLLSYHMKINVKGSWVKNDKIHKGQKIRFGGINSLRGYRDDQFISANLCIPTIELVSNISRDIQFLTFVESAIQKEYVPYPLGFGFGIKQISKSSIISATIGYGRGDIFSEGKLHIKFSSRL